MADNKENYEIDETIKLLQDETLNNEVEEEYIEITAPVINLVNKILIEAIARNADYIHIEPYPGDQNTLVRMRINGVCLVYQTIPYNYRNAVLSRIKIMAEMEVSEHPISQTGKICFKYGGPNIDLSVVTIPTANGMEDAIIHILPGEPIPLSNIGFSENNYKEFLRIITQVHGLVIISGPKDSGKTTTLHSAIAHINKDETKMWTIEKRLEIIQKGLRQVTFESDSDFNTLIQNILLADPDIIVIGEICNKQTASFALAAAQRGHLVLSTCYGNTAAETISNFLELGVNPRIFANVFQGVLCQKLVRTLCNKCRQSFPVSEITFNELVAAYGEEDFNKEISVEHTDDFMFYLSEGCEHCHQTGYKGRIAFHELLAGTTELKLLIQRNSVTQDFYNQGIEDGMQTFIQDGIAKIFAGNQEIDADVPELGDICPDIDPVFELETEANDNDFSDTFNMGIHTDDDEEDELELDLDYKPETSKVTSLEFDLESESCFDESDEDFDLDMDVEEPDAQESSEDLLLDFDLDSDIDLDPEPVNDEATLFPERKYHENTPNYSEKNKILDPVDCTVFSPPEVKAGEFFMIQVYVHLLEKADEALEMAKEFDYDTARRGFTSLETEIERGSKLTFHMDIKDVTIAEPFQSFKWQGRTDYAAFYVGIPEEYLSDNIFGKVTISQDSVPIGHIRFKIRVICEKKKLFREPIGNALTYKYAFISYASKDRSEVIRRVQMLSTLKISFFQDILNLEPGDRWEKELYKEIDKSDVFFLFWSKSAKESEWVKKEILHALRAKQYKDENPPEIIPIIIEGPPVPIPPEELQHIHFNDRLAYFV
ncbi:ATPase, T2SS/T4P/T4SS family [Desulfobacterales bacterium HSG17]|nr:ATPase, T2SS/T4P/T4SS family [Desulfobacterales bacterium HSG17]